MRWLSLMPLKQLASSVKRHFNGTGPEIQNVACSSTGRETKPENISQDLPVPLTTRRQNTIENKANLSCNHHYGLVQI